LEDLLKLITYDEHFLNICYYILIAGDCGLFYNYQNKLLTSILNNIITNINFDSENMKNFLIRLLEDREIYTKYFINNNYNLELLFALITKKISLEYKLENDKIKSTKTDNNNNNNIIIAYNNKKTTFSKYFCNLNILQIFGKLTQNFILDIEMKLEALDLLSKEKKTTLNSIKMNTSKTGDLLLMTKKAINMKMCYTSNWHMTINNLIEVNVAGVIIKKPRVIITAPSDYEKELESDDEEPDEEDEENIFFMKNISVSMKENNFNEKNVYLKDDYDYDDDDDDCQKCKYNKELNLDNFLDQNKIIKQLTTILDIIILNFNQNLTHKQASFGQDNMYKISCFNNIIEILINVNFFYYVKENLQNNNKKITCELILNHANIETESSNSNLFFEKDNHKINSIQISNEILAEFMDNIFKCFFKFQQHSLMHKEIEILVTFIANEFCPFQFIEIFMSESQSLSHFIKINKNITSKEEIIHHLINICEVLVRIFLSDNPNINNYLELSKINLIFVFFNII
jgi:hypothetical protein